MNINDVKNTENIPKDIWKAIWNKQKQLADKYSDIEGMDDLLETTKNNINTAKGQKWIKDFAWRVTEELTEADEAKYEFENNHDLTKDDWKDSEYRIHYLEEVTDALHFFVELCIITGYSHEDFDYNCPIYNSDSYMVIYQLGLMCNCLKNKPWKQSQMLTDRVKFETYLKNAFRELRNLFYSEYLEDVDIYQFYFKKNAVNQFRIRSKY